MGGSKCQPLWHKWCHAISWPYRLRRTSSKQSKRGNDDQTIQLGNVSTLTISTRDLDIVLNFGISKPFLPWIVNSSSVDLSTLNYKSDHFKGGLSISDIWVFQFLFPYVQRLALSTSFVFILDFSLETCKEKNSFNNIENCLPVKSDRRNGQGKGDK